MNGHFQCGAPSCRWTFESSGALLRHHPSCLSYQQQAATQMNFWCKHLQSNTCHESVTFKKLKLLQENVCESIMAILTWSHLIDNRRMTRQNPICPVPPQLHYCCHHTPLSHLNVLSMASYWMLAPVRLWFWSTDYHYTMFIAVLSTLTLSHLSDSRKLRQQNPIFPAAPQLCCYHHHSALAHLNVLKVVPCWMLAPFKLWMQRVSHQCSMSWDISLTMICGARRFKLPSPFKTFTCTI